MWQHGMGNFNHIFHRHYAFAKILLRSISVSTSNNESHGGVCGQKHPSCIVTLQSILIAFYAKMMHWSKFYQGEFSSVFSKESYIPPHIHIFFILQHSDTVFWANSPQITQSNKVRKEF